MKHLITLLLICTVAFSKVIPTQEQFRDMQYTYHFGEATCIETFSPSNAKVSEYILSIPDAKVLDHYPNKFLIVGSKQKDGYWVFFNNVSLCYEFKYIKANDDLTKKAY